MMSLPKDEAELKAIHSSQMPHPAMKMASNAIKTHRSPSQAFILLLGISGSGKSSTINYLFGKKLATVTDFTSGQHATEEYCVSMNSEEWRIKDLRLSFIDTPGFCDDDGLEQDAKNIATILHFTKNHERLRNKFPNLVFLVIDSTDNRIEGNKSRFAKLLRGIKLLKVIDKKNPNLVVVLTHVASLARKRESWERKVAEVKEKILSLVLCHIGIRPCIVVQENKPFDFDLEKNGDWHVLPNGQNQPKELFLVCKNILNSAHDEIGHEAVALCFRSGKNNPERGLIISETDIEESEVEKIISSWSDYNKKELNSPICKILDTYKMKNKTKELEYDVLILKYRFSELEIKYPNDIQCKSINQLKAIFHPVEISSQMEEMLKALFGLMYEESSGIVCPIGKGFNIFHDVQIQKCPLVLENNNAQFGYPRNTKFYDCSIFNVKCESFMNQNEYKKQRLGELNFMGDISAHLGICEMKVRGGYNMDDKASTVHKLHQVSFHIEHTLYEVDLNSPYIPTKEFKKDVRALPTEYNEHDKDNLLKWKAFIEKWGNHFIVGVRLGGSIHGKALMRRSKNCELKDLCTHVMSEITLRYHILQSGAETNYERKSLYSQDNEVLISTSSLEWNGGDRSYFKSSLESLRSEELEKWEKSLRYKPAPLSASPKLCPIYELVKQIDKEKSHEMQKASKIQSDIKVFEQNTRESVGASNKRQSCFPSTASVILVNGCKKKLKDIYVGENVLSIDRCGNITVDKVIAWIHKVENTECKFLRIVHQFGTLEISEEHMVYSGKNKAACPAKEVKLGDTLHTFRHRKEGGMFVQSTVCSIEEVNGHGLYAPLTLNGNIVIDGIFVSCYCLVKSIHFGKLQVVSCHSLAHLAFLPLRLAYKIKLNINEEKYSEETGIHKYAEWLMKIAMAKT